MEKNKSSTLNSSTESSDQNIKSKLRRLRIQESLLLQSLQKSSTDNKEYKENTEEDNDDSMEYRILLKKVKDSYINLKNLYDEVKTSAKSQELLVELDIEDMKKKVFQLENNMKSFKSYINSELATLKMAEQNIIRQINESPNDTETIKRRSKIKSVNYKAIIPSPVRAIMSCPFKCSEVQEFQDFMKNSLNRYGGWNEYNHNTFVKYWQKYFGKNYTPELHDGNIQESPTHEMFIEEVLAKVQGVTINDISSHAKWYAKFLFLKDRQQNAINKWKWSKTTAKKVLKQGSVKFADAEDNFQLKTAMDDNNFIASTLNASQCDQLRVVKKLANTNNIETQTKLSKKRLHRTQSIMKPTKQWLNRNLTDHLKESSNFNSIENNSQKLRTPDWRLGLL